MCPLELASDKFGDLRVTTGSEAQLVDEVAALVDEKPSDRLPVAVIRKSFRQQHHAASREHAVLQGSRRPVPTLQRKYRKRRDGHEDARSYAGNDSQPTLLSFLVLLSQPGHFLVRDVQERSNDLDLFGSQSRRAGRVEVPEPAGAT